MYYLNPSSKLRLNEFVIIRASRFFYTFVIVICTTTIMHVLNSQIKVSSFFQMQVQGCYFELLFCFLLMQAKIEP